MINNPDYSLATNAAYEILQNYESNFPQVDVFRIILSYPQIAVHTYSEMAKRFNVSTLDFSFNIAPSEYGYTVYDKKRKCWLLYYNDTKCERTIRFTLAHELGHIVLMHDTDDSNENKEANCFARNLLCPVPLREELGLKTPDDYCNAFDISEPMAEATIDLTPSDFYYCSANETLPKGEAINRKYLGKKPPTYCMYFKVF